MARGSQFSLSDVLLCYKQSVGGSLLVITLTICVTSPLFAQCPSSDPAHSESKARTLEGRLVFHDGIRSWFELKLDQPECGEASIQLLQEVRHSKSLEILRGCRIKSHGALDFSPTGYYSLGVYQSVQQVEPLGACVHKSPLPDPPSAKPDKAIPEGRFSINEANWRGCCLVPAPATRRAATADAFFNSWLLLCLAALPETMERLQMLSPPMAQQTLPAQRAS